MSEQAKYRCNKCKHEWDQKPGPTKCPKCSHVFVTWLNHPLTVEKEPSFFDKIKIIDKALDEANE